MPTNLLSPDNSLMVVIDLQPKLSLVMPRADSKPVIANVCSLVDAAVILKIPVFLSELCPKILGETEKSIARRVIGIRQTFSKTTFSCFSAEGFYLALKKTGRRQIVLVGQETHLSVLQTAMDLRHIGYEVFVVEDAVCSRKIRHNLNGLQRMKQQEVTIINYESVLFEWIRDSTHPDFRKVSTLIRQ